MAAKDKEHLDRIKERNEALKEAIREHEAAKAAAADARKNYDQAVEALCEEVDDTQGRLTLADADVDESTGKLKAKK